MDSGDQCGLIHLKERLQLAASIPLQHDRRPFDSLGRLAPSDACPPKAGTRTLLTTGPVRQNSSCPPIFRSGNFGRSTEGRGLRGRGQDHNVDWLVPATYRYPIAAAPRVLRLNERVKRRCKHNLAW